MSGFALWFIGLVVEDIISLVTPLKWNLFLPVEQDLWAAAWSCPCPTKDKGEGCDYGSATLRHWRPIWVQFWVSHSQINTMNVVSSCNTLIYTVWGNWASIFSSRGWHYLGPRTNSCTWATDLGQGTLVKLAQCFKVTERFTIPFHMLQLIHQVSPISS